jgi:hypothetical protein
MTAIPRDWLARALQGNYYGDYYDTWVGAHARAAYRPGVWCEDQYGRAWWVTDTPDWDRGWFRAQGVRPPQRIGSTDRTEWVQVDERTRIMRYRSPRWPW